MEVGFISRKRNQVKKWNSESNLGAPHRPGSRPFGFLTFVLISRRRGSRMVLDGSFTFECLFWIQHIRGAAYIAEKCRRSHDTGQCCGIGSFSSGRVCAFRNTADRLSIGWRAMSILTTLTLKHAHMMSLEGKFMTFRSVSILRLAIAPCISCGTSGPDSGNLSLIFSCVTSCRSFKEWISKKNLGLTQKKTSSLWLASPAAGFGGGIIRFLWH